MDWFSHVLKRWPFKGRPFAHSWNLSRRLNAPASLGLRVGFVVAIALTTVFLTNPAPERYRVGAVAERTIRADREVMAPDPAATAAARLTAYQETAPIFILDERKTDLVIGQIRRLFRQGREYLTSLGQIPQKFRDEFTTFFSSPDQGELLAATVASGFNENLERAVAWLTLELMTQGVLEDREDLNQFSGRTVEVDRLGLGVANFTSYDSLLTKSRAKYLINSRSRLMELESHFLNGRLVGRLVLASLTPNLTLDQEKLDLKRFQAVTAVKEIRHYVAEGEILAREGEKVTPLINLKLNALRENTASRRWLLSSLGLLAIFLVYMGVSQTVSALEKKYLFTNREQILVAVLILMILFMAWSAARLGRNLTHSFDNIEIHTVFLAMPFATMAIIGSIFLGLRRTIFITFLSSLPAAAVSPLDTLTAFVYICNGSMIANWRLKHISERGRLIPAAGLTALVNCLTVLGVAIFNGDSIFASQFLFDLDAALLSGLLSGVLASGLVPFFEMTLGFTTNLKLMELGNLNRPILRELMLVAPGTYHHSVIVGSMVEAAAEAIGANHHLARVGAYYHDIGKIKKPLYFIENQLGENKHESLTPTMSALVLVGHVKDGVEMAKANGLPPSVVDIVEQHHGTSLMSFFYHKAIERKGPNSPEVNEGDFRYPGPKPASKEAGLVMLADICEAATRTLTEPTPTKIRELVRTLINRIFDDGQLDASDLVLKDVTDTIRVFNNILVGIYHHRIAYPVVAKAARNEQVVKSKVIYGHISGEQSKRLAH